MRLHSNPPSLSLVLSILPFLALGDSTASHIDRGHHRSTGAITWGACSIPNPNNVPVQCAKFPVPLDYTDSSSNKTLALDLIKYSAPNNHSRGSVILNFGGPGQDGLTNMLGYAPVMSRILGNQFDLISFDPRGTGNTLLFDCFGNDTTAQAIENYLNNTSYKSSEAALGRMWASAEIVANVCYENLKDTGDLVGMAFTSRDILQIVDALDEDKMVRYWGVSGGTALGATMAAMFPDQMDKVLLDGVLNAHEYYHGFGMPEMFARTDSTWEGFLAGCLASPSTCDLARPDRTVDSLKTAIDKAIDDLRVNPVPYGEIIIDDYAVKWNIGMLLYVAPFYGSLATGLDALLAGDAVSFYTNTTRQDVPEWAQALIGISCGDKIDRASSLDEIRPGIAKYEEMSPFSDLAINYYGFHCAPWRFEAKERYTGDFNVKTKNPLLFVGNTFDPVTPYVSAKNMSLSFPGSGFLQSNTYGHTTLSGQDSTCTFKAIFNYFDKGVLPEPDTLCEADEPIFTKSMLVPVNPALRGQ